MTTSFESRLREDLRTLADVPPPDGPADRALAGARRARRTRAGLAVGGSLAAAALVAVPLVVDLPGGGPLGVAGAPTPCETATDEAQPANGVPRAEYPQFVRAIVAKLPPRGDYSLQSAVGICAFPGYPANGYAVINLGPNREHGHLTVTISYQSGERTCAAVKGPERETVFCEEGTDTTPLVLGERWDADSIVVTAVQPDMHSVRIEALGTPLDAAAIRPVATAPELAQLLP